MWHGCRKRKACVSNGKRDREGWRGREGGVGHKRSKHEKQEGEWKRKKTWLTGVYLNERSFQLVVCRNHYYLPFSSLFLLSSSFPLLSALLISFCLSFPPHLAVRSSSAVLKVSRWHWALLNHWRCPQANSVYDLTATWTLTRKHTRAYVIQMHINIQGHTDPDTHTHSQKEQIRWMTSDISG